VLADHCLSAGLKQSTTTLLLNAVHHTSKHDHAHRMHLLAETLLSRIHNPMHHVHNSATGSRHAAEHKTTSLPTGTCSTDSSHFAMQACHLQPHKASCTSAEHTGSHLNTQGRRASTQCQLPAHLAAPATCELLQAKPARLRQQ
jgi:hypothetical protein